MKILVLIVITLITFQTFSQAELTKQQWEEDLRFLQKTIHNDYPFLFKKTTVKEFDSAVEELSEAIPKLEPHEIVVGLARIISSFKYGHTALGFRHNTKMFTQLPINFHLFNDGLYIQGAHKDYDEVVGAKVLRIGKMSTEDAMKAVYPVSPNENDQYFKSYGLRYLLIPQVLHAQGVIESLDEGVTLALEMEGKKIESIVMPLPNGENIKSSYGFILQDEDWRDARNQDQTPYYLKNLDKIYYYEYLPEHKTVYVRQSQIQDDTSQDIPTFYNEVFNFIETNDVEKLVLDVRLNGGGNNYKNKAVVTGIIKSEKINKVGNFFVIIGRKTFSACQNLVNELDNYTNAIFVGEPTAENINFYGDNRQVDLPHSKIPVYLSWAWWQDKPQWENKEWLAPHIAVTMSYDDYKNNQDPVLAAALNFDDSNFVLNPMAYITELFEKNEIEKLKSETFRMVKDPKYAFFDFEQNFNQAGYQLLNQGRSKEAIFVFSMITEIFPESANAWDSLAEGYLNAGDKAKATELYNKVITMDPSGNTGNNAKQMLLKMKHEENLEKKD